ncbi:MAG: F0F1 ATP synthase subunit A [Chloroflexi bacterium]|nr:F0F1 ATP synthase subunit A [Chloroflexota bacterium]
MAMALVAFLVLFVVGLAGGALGDKFGAGFLSSPLPHLQLAAEKVTANEQFPGFTITNTMIATWASIVLLLIISFFATRKITEVPRGLQNFFEAVFEYFINLAESVAGRERARVFLPLVMTIFLFIVMSNWMGILPGYATIGRIESPEEFIHHAEERVEKQVKEAEEKGETVDEHALLVSELGNTKFSTFNGEGSVGITPFGSVSDQISAVDYLEAEEHGEHIVPEGQQAGILVPFLRSANTDVNTTLAIALVAMVLVHFWGFRRLGFFTHLGKFINFKQGPIWFFVGILEGISEIAKVISFTFRLFGNIFAGEVLLVAMAFLIPLIGIVPFLGLELFVGLIQAFIFSMLTLVFASAATVSHGAEGH